MIALLSLAWATEPPTERDFALGVGAFFNAGGTFMTQPSDLSHPNERIIELPFSGWAGFSPGGGLSLDFRFRDFIGVEVDLIRSMDTAQSEYTLDGVDFPFKVTVPSWHIPVMLKGGIPSRTVSPNLFVGLETVIPGTIDFPPVEGVPWQMTAQTETYSLFFFGLGFEGRLPIEGVDIRVPFSIRGSMQPSYPAKATDRAVYDISADGVIRSMEYDLRWQYHAAVTLGMSYYFL